MPDAGLISNEGGYQVRVPFAFGGDGIAEVIFKITDPPVIKIFSNTLNPGTGPATLIETLEYSYDYEAAITDHIQAPAGKKLLCVFRVGVSNADADLSMYVSDTLDSATGFKVVDSYSGITQVYPNMIVILNENQYLNMEAVNNSSARNHSCTGFTVELPDDFDIGV